MPSGTGASSGNPTANKDKIIGLFKDFGKGEYFVLLIPRYCSPFVELPTLSASVHDRRYIFLLG